MFRYLLWNSHPKPYIYVYFTSKQSNNYNIRFKLNKRIIVPRFVNLFSVLLSRPFACLLKWMSLDEQDPFWHCITYLVLMHINPNWTWKENCSETSGNESYLIVIWNRSLSGCWNKGYTWQFWSNENQSNKINRESFKRNAKTAVNLTVLKGQFPAQGQGMKPGNDRLLEPTLGNRPLGVVKRDPSRVSTSTQHHIPLPTNPNLLCSN